jgi:hypothetical protein
MAKLTMSSRSTPCSARAQRTPECGARVARDTVELKSDDTLPVRGADAPWPTTGAGRLLARASGTATDAELAEPRVPLP